MKDALLSLLFQLSPLLLTAITAGLTWLLTWAGTYFKVRAASSKLAGIMVRVDELALAIVHDLESGLKAELERARADGVITPEEGRILKEAALKRLKTSLGEHGLAALQAALGLAAGPLETFLSGKLEAGVAAVSAQSRVGELVSPPVPR